jgi:hypothetical protein
MRLMSYGNAVSGTFRVASVGNDVGLSLNVIGSHTPLIYQWLQKLGDRPLSASLSKLNDFSTHVTLVDHIVSFDLDLPIECDDEYWETEDPAQVFKQPAGVPSVLSFFIHSVRLRQTQLRAMRSLVSSRTSTLGKCIELCLVLPRIRS